MTQEPGKSYVKMGELQQFFQNIFDKIKAMAQIAWLKVPSNGGFIANYNDRNGMKEMEEKRKIDEDKNMISLKEKTETRRRKIKT